MAVASRISSTAQTKATDDLAARGLSFDLFGNSAQSVVEQFGIINDQIAAYQDEVEQLRISQKQAIAEGNTQLQAELDRQIADIENATNYLRAGLEKFDYSRLEQSLTDEANLLMESLQKQIEDGSLSVQEAVEQILANMDVSDLAALKGTEAGQQFIQNLIAALQSQNVSDNIDMSKYYGSEDYNNAIDKADFEAEEYEKLRAAVLSSNDAIRESSQTISSHRKQVEDEIKILNREIQYYDGLSKRVKSNSSEYKNYQNVISNSKKRLEELTSELKKQEKSFEDNLLAEVRAERGAKTIQDA